MTRRIAVPNVGWRFDATCRAGHPRTKESTATYTLKDGTTVRTCRICARASGKKSDHKRRRSA